MSKSEKLVSSKGIIIDLILTLGFFLYMITVCREHVPSTVESDIMFFGIFTAMCVSGVFWLALQCFRVTCMDQLKHKK